MAVKFLDNLDLNDNQLLNARLENLASDPGSANAGDIIYNSTSNVFKYYNGSSWVNPATGSYTSWTVTADSGGSVTVPDGAGVDWAGGDGISTAYSTPSGARTVTITNTDKGSAQNIFKTIAVSGQNNIVADNNADTLTFVAGTGITLTSDSTTDSLTIAAAGSGTMSNWVLAADSGQTQQITNGETVTMTGGVGVVTVTGTNSVSFATDLEELPTLTPAGGSNDSLVYLQDGSDQAKAAIDQFPINEFGAANGTLNMGNNQITSLATPTGTTDAATKAYVDTQLAGSGSLIFQGGYDAATNTPDLDSSPSSSIKKGWSYVVTAAGTFFSETVEIGDFLIAQQDAPTALANWVTVQNNIGIATSSTPGIASFPTAGGLTVTAAGAVSMAALGSAGTGGASATATTGVTIDTKGRVTGFTSTNIDITTSQISNFTTSVNSNISAREFQGTNGSAGTSHTITHNLNSRDVIVEIYDSSTYETVFAKVVRTSTSVVTITTASSIALGAITVLVRKVG